MGAKTPVPSLCDEGSYGAARVYIMENKRNGTLYTGITSDLLQRVHKHRERLMPGFSSRYGCTLLVWYERHDEMPAAIAREKQIKAGSRRKKLALMWRR